MEDLFGGKLQGLMQQAQAMQKQMAEAQERAARREVTGEAGGGLVKVTANGVPAIVRVTLDPVTVTDLEMLQDLIVAATNDALKKAKEAVEVELGPLAQMLKASGLGGF
ncbi:MAG: YbaB/EbfC family nucleoid-associated protein [Deltaproteobacteria bacterium]|nr:YbaB/EbfC family nucleoid-associated protein [Deltaproteobacteria bacterium]